jgi:hypothetical protein
MLLCGGCVLGSSQDSGSSTLRFPLLSLTFAVVGLVSIWMLYRICRMGARFDDCGVTVRKFFRISRF